MHEPDYLYLCHQVREFSFMFGPGPLGIVLDNNSGAGPSTMVSSFTDVTPPGVTGEPQVKEGMGLAVGDLVSKINGEGVTDLTHEQVLWHLRKPRPILIHFIGYYR